MTVFEEVRNIIVEIKDIPEEDITLESNFADDLEADSLDIVEMLMSLEDKFSIHIPEEVAEEMKTVQDAVDYIEKELK
jgi:acyl carrier protein